MSNPSISLNSPKNSNRYFFSPAPEVYAQEPEVLSTAPNKQMDEFAILAEHINNNPYAIVITRATESDKNSGLELDLNPSWNIITLFFSKIISWIKDNASNKLIKEHFVKYIIDKLGNADDVKTNGIRESLANIVDPTSGWPLELRAVKKFVDEIASYSCQTDLQAEADEQDNLTTPCKQAKTVEEDSSPIVRDLLPEFSETKEDVTHSNSGLDALPKVSEPIIDNQNNNSKKVDNITFDKSASRLPLSKEEEEERKERSRQLMIGLGIPD